MNATPEVTAVTTTAETSTAAPVADIAVVGQTAPKRSAADDFVDSDDEEDLSPEAQAELEAVFGSDSKPGDSAEASEEGEAADEAGSNESVGDGVDITSLSELEDEESDAIVEIFKKKCLECAALVPWKEKTYKSCHFSSGNDHCPAKSIRIQTRIPLEDIVPRFLAAEEQNDTDRLERLYAKLKTWEPWKQETVHQALKAERIKRISQPV